MGARQKAAEALAARIREEHIRGVEPGTRFPSVVELGMSTHATAGTIREAVQLLLETGEIVADPAYPDAGWHLVQVPGGRRPASAATPRRGMAGQLAEAAGEPIDVLRPSGAIRCGRWSIDPSGEIAVRGVIPMAATPPDHHNPKDPADAYALAAAIAAWAER